MADGEEIVRIQLSDGTILHVQARQLGGEEDVSAFDKILAFDNVMAAIAGVADALTRVRDKVKPRKASVEFGIEIAVQSGELTALLVQGTGTANLKITMEWSE